MSALELELKQLDYLTTLEQSEVAEAAAVLSARELEVAKLAAALASQPAVSRSIATAPSMADAAAIERHCLSVASASR